MTKVMRGREQPRSLFAVLDFNDFVTPAML